MPVIDGDGHVMEPMRASDSVPEKCRPGVTRDSIGLDHVYVGDARALYRLP